MAIRSKRVRLRDRSIALMHVLLLLSGVALLASAITLSLLLGAVVHRQASSDIRGDLSHATSVVLSSSRVGDLLTKPAAAATVSDRLLHNPYAAQVEVVSNSSSSSHIRYIRLSIAPVFLILFALLALLLRSASRVLRGRKRALQQESEALLDAYRRLEQSSFEAIESLNAAVDAKDPSTAGHSQRVEQIALRIGRELEFDPARLELLRLGALFHDIGKLAVPDAILLKPARLTRQEFEVIKRHCDNGARIVDHFGPLRPVVSIVRHHHEQWSGAGYPAGFEGETIPLEASIVGAADSWDAMTTNRPYKAMLSVEEAREEVKRCRGTQFHPDVIDALLSALDQDPEVFAPLEPQLEAGNEKCSVPSLGVAGDSGAIGFSEA